MTKLIYRCRSSIGSLGALVVQSDPQCRTILYSPSESPRRFFVSLPYLLFIIVHDYDMNFRCLHAFFLPKPLESATTPLWATCFPNIDVDGGVCLGDSRLEGGSEEKLIQSALDAFWTTAFTGWQRNDAVLGIHELAKLTKTERDAGMRVFCRSGATTSLSCFYFGWENADWEGA